MSLSNNPPPENTARTASEWVFVAKSLARLSGDEEHALSCMERAWQLAESVSDWIELASAWKLNFNNPGEAGHCMSMAESCGEVRNSWESWIELAIAWEKVIGDDDRAKHWYAKANALDEETPDVTYFIKNARALKNKFKDRETGLRYLEQAELRAENYRDWIQLAEAWKGSFRRRRDGLRCLGEAEALAEKFEDWVELFRFWRKFSQETKKSIECLERAESLATQYSEWMTLAEISMAEFRDSITGIRCLNVAEGVAESSSDWVQLARSWMGNLGDRENGVRCMEQAEAVAKTEYDWGAIAGIWEVTFQDSENYLRCMRTGYGNVNRFHLWGSAMDSFTNWLVDQRAISEGGITSLGIIKDSSSFQGCWSEQILSQRRTGCRARYYSFRVYESGSLSICLNPGEDTYLCLMLGEDTNGPVLAEHEGPLAESSNACFSNNLTAGVYTIEATKCDESGEAFMLTIAPRRDHDP